MTLNFEKEKLISELKERKPKKVLVQLAEGIKQNAPEISEWIESLGIECIFSGETCWGACSVAVQEAQALGVDLIVHFGHAEFIKVDFPILYMEVQDVLDLNPLLNKSLPHLKEFDKIGLSYSIQHRHDIENIKKFYESQGKIVTLSKKAGTNAYEGHITGCEYRGLKAIQDDVDCFVIIGNQFHSMGASLALKKPVILIDVYNDDVRSMAGLREKILKQRLFSIEKLREAKNVGIIVEIKPGQKFGNPVKLLEKFRQHGKTAIVITMSELTPDKLMNFYNIDAFVELACPRIALDDFAKYPKPILTIVEAMVALGEKSWEQIVEGGIV
ncbi:MAG TPA: diphthamide biosynthesis enzyme Dph2 [Candidatus Nanoarchaeia archaeon]|nr:diphthamide biosynthesis enzyme Dph2 [Candidatus Nanoarchaeia archaeon]